MRRILPYVALLLVYLMTPSAGEITENVVHLLTEGHTAHALNDDAHTPDGPEHGCSGPYHVCACHASVAFTVSMATAGVGSALIEEAAVARWREDPPSEGHLDGIFRPPIV